MLHSSNKVYVYIVIILLLSPASLWGAKKVMFIPQRCIDKQGGYCVTLSSSARAQASALDFLGISKDAGISDLMQALYVFGLASVGLSALIMVVWGGVEYMIAGDNEGLVRKGRDRIKKALLGLSLAFGSWLILFTINPEIVRKLDLVMPNLREIKPNAQTQQNQDGQQSGNKPLCTSDTFKCRLGDEAPCVCEANKQLKCRASTQGVPSFWDCF